MMSTPVAAAAPRRVRIESIKRGATELESALVHGTVAAAQEWMEYEEGKRTTPPQAPGGLTPVEN
jgi:hypothetical protein